MIDCDGQEIDFYYLDNNTVGQLYSEGVALTSPTRTGWFLPLAFQRALRDRIRVLTPHGTVGLSTDAPTSKVTSIRQYNRADSRENRFKTEGRKCANEKIQFILGSNAPTLGNLMEAYTYSRFQDSEYYCPNGFPWQYLCCLEKLVH